MANKKIVFQSNLGGKKTKIILLTEIFIHFSLHKTGDFTFPFQTVLQHLLSQDMTEAARPHLED